MSELFEISIDVNNPEKESYDNGKGGTIERVYSNDAANDAATSLTNVLKAISCRYLHVRSAGEKGVHVVQNWSPHWAIQAVKLVSEIYPDGTFRVDIVGPMGYGDEYYEGVRFTSDTQANADIKNGDVHNLLHGDTPLIEEEQSVKPSAGIHKLLIRDIQNLAPDGKERVRIVFDVTDEQGKDGQNLKLIINFERSFTPGSMLYTKLLGPLGVNVQNEKFQTDDFIGLKFMAVIEHNTGADGKTYANLGSALRG